MNSKYILGIGSVVEFLGKDLDGRVNGETYIDRISTIHLQQNGEVHYWTDMYPELNNTEPELTPDRLIRVVEEVKYHYPKLLEPPCNVGDIISFAWDEKTLYGKVNRVYFNIDLDSNGWCIEACDDNYCIHNTDDHEVKITKKGELWIK